MLTSDDYNDTDWCRGWEGRVVLIVGIFFSKSFTLTSFNMDHVIQGRCLLITAQFDQLSAFTNV